MLVLLFVINFYSQKILRRLLVRRNSTMKCFSLGNSNCMRSKNVLTVGTYILCSLSY